MKQTLVIEVETGTYDPAISQQIANLVVAEITRTVTGEIFEDYYYDSFGSHEGLSDHESAQLSVDAEDAFENFSVTATKITIDATKV